MKNLNVFQKLIVFLMLSSFIISCSSDEQDSSTEVTNSTETEEFGYTSYLRMSLREQLADYEQEFRLFSSDIQTYKASISEYPEAQQKDLLEQRMRPFAERTTLLLGNFGVTEEDIEDIYGSAFSSEIIISGIYLLWNESTNETYVTNVDWGEIVGCAIAVLGLNIFDGIRSGVIMTKAILIRTVRTFATKIMGPIGIAITVAEFGICLAGF